MTGQTTIVLSPLPTIPVGKKPLPGQKDKRSRLCPLSPNARVHYMVKAKYTKLVRTEAKLRAMQGPREQWERAETRIVYYHTRNARRDGDNALMCLKAAFDGFRDAGMIKDDSGLMHHPVEFRVDPARPRIEITVTEIVDENTQKKLWKEAW